MLSASDLKLTDFQRACVYNMLGVTYFSLGNYEDALKNYTRAETLNLTADEINTITSATLVNRALIYGKRKLYDKAILYYERAIRNYENDINLSEQTAKDDTTLFKGLALAYHDLGTVYSERSEFSTALDYFKTSLSLMEKHKVEEKELPLSSLAKCYARFQNPSLADEYFKRCIAACINEKGTEYYRLYEVYVLYADFIADEGGFKEASSIYRSVLNYCLRKYGLKNAHTSSAYINLGELKFKTSEYDSSLYFYQKSLISAVSNFNDENIESNPKIDSAYFDVRLLDNMKGKSKVLASLAKSMNSQKNQVKTLELSLVTAELAMDLLDIIRGNFPTEDSKIYLSEIEKETYISGIRVASDLYLLTKNNGLLDRMYNIVSRSKAAVLRNQIRDNKILYASAISDSLIEKQRRLASNIAGYKMIILKEENSELPAKIKINLWKDELFQMTALKEAIDKQINDELPPHSDLSEKTKIIPLKEIMNNLERDESIIDYFLSDKYTDGKRDLFIFLIDREELRFFRTSVDSIFIVNATILKNTTDPSMREKRRDIKQYLSASNSMYNTLIKPVESRLKKRLIVIPDEEINWLTFESFITAMPSGDPVDFEGLHFLLSEHPISHVYSSSMIPPPAKVKNGKVCAFSPVYDNVSGFNFLNGAKNEIESVIGIMGGKVITGTDASRANFLKSMQDDVLFHLAMHSVYDSINSLNSYLLFTGNGLNTESARLYNYEISFDRIKTPMVVLSSCSSGAGTLRRSEGLMSIARSFILAGASSVVRTAWEVNDDSGSEIITRFYHYLSKGYSKDRALQLSKIDFLEQAAPSFHDPYYWGTYEVLGDNSPVRHGKGKIVTFVTISILIIVSGVYFYLRRRRILAARLP